MSKNQIDVKNSELLTKVGKVTKSSWNPNLNESSNRYGLQGFELKDNLPNETAICFWKGIGISQIVVDTREYLINCVIT